MRSARAAVMGAVASASARSSMGRIMSGGAATGERHNPVHTVLGPLAQRIPDPGYSWLLLCCGDESRWRRVSHALHDVAVIRFPRHDEDRMMVLCELVALDVSRPDDLRIKLNPEAVRLMEESGEPCPQTQRWSGAMFARAMRLSTSVYSREWSRVRDGAEDVLGEWSDAAWPMARDVLEDQGVLSQ